MAVTLPKFESLVVINSTNKVVRANFGAGAVSVTLSEGNYFVGSALAVGDGGTGISLAEEFREKIDTADGGATYSFTLSAAGRYTLTRSTGSITLLFSDALNTFDEEILGYAAGVDKTISTATTTVSKVKYDWYAPIPASLDHKLPSGIRNRNVSLSGVEFVDEILEYDSRLVTFELLAARYINASDEPATGTNEAFVGDRLSSTAQLRVRFWDKVKNQNHFRYYPDAGDSTVYFDAIPTDDAWIMDMPAQVRGDIPVLYYSLSFLMREWEAG